MTEFLNCNGKSDTLLKTIWKYLAWIIVRQKTLEENSIQTSFVVTR